jgi:adenylate kinase
MADIYVFLGPPGVGKGTLGDLFCAETGAIHVSTGQLLRDEMAKHSEIGIQVKDLIAKGELISDDVVAAMVTNRLGEKDIQSKGCLLDGFPRTTHQADLLDSILTETAVLLIEADRDMLISRLTSRRVCSNQACGAIYNINSQRPAKEGICDRCGSKLVQRSDDSESTAIERLHVYDVQTAPLIAYYTASGQLVRTQSRDVDAKENYQALKTALA